MEIFLARQAIYNINMEVVGYEILYRSSNENKFDPTIGEERATYMVIQNIATFGLGELTNSKDTFINFPQKALENNIGTLLPRDTTIIEVLESVEPTLDVISNLIYIKSLGYRIALDDVSDWKSIIPYLDIVDIVKVDMKTTDLKKRKEIIDFVKDKKIIILAEKIETKEELEECKKLGFTHFQGFLFSKPDMLLGNDVSLRNITIYRLLIELIKNDVNVEYIDSIMKTDLLLTYKFLRFINSAYFSFVQEVSSIKQAIMLVGRNEMRKWLSVIALTQMDTGACEEYANNTIIRAKFCELVAENLDISIDASSSFLVGLFSEINLLIQKEMESIVKELPFKSEVKEALIEKDNIYRNIYLLCKNYENFESKDFTKYCKKVNIPEEKIGKLYLKAIEWGDDLLKYK